MNREILFKAKRKDNGEWCFGQLVFDKNKIPFIVEEVERENQDEVTDLYATEWYEVIPSTVGQYTELTDKNGKKIFENDIVKARYEENNGYIKWNSNNASFQIKGIPSHTLKRADELEVIGNIHDEVQE